MLQPYYEIVEKQRGEMVVSHLTISQYTGIKEESIARLIRDYRGNLEVFGNLGFKIRGLERTNAKGQNRGIVEAKTYYLNEEQSTFLMMLLRNTPMVVKFKMDLTQEFFLMRNQIMRQLKYTKDGKNRMLSCGVHKGNYRKAKKTIKKLKAKLAEAEKWKRIAEIAHGMAASEVGNLKKELAWYKEKTKNFRFGSYK